MSGKRRCRPFFVKYGRQRDLAVTGVRETTWSPRRIGRRRGGSRWLKIYHTWCYRYRNDGGHPRDLGCARSRPSRSPASPIAREWKMPRCAMPSDALGATWSMPISAAGSSSSALPEGDRAGPAGSAPSRCFAGTSARSSSTALRRAVGRTSVGTNSGLSGCWPARCSHWTRRVSRRRWRMERSSR